MNEFCFSHQLDFEIRYTEYPGHAKVLAQEYYEQEQTVIVAVGGDGTVNEVASSLIGAKALFHVIPCGSGNGFARHNNIPLTHTRNLVLMQKAAGARSVDVCFLNNIPFFNVSGIGFDAFISQKFSEIKGRGFSNYIRAVLTHYHKAKNCNFTIVINNEQINLKALFISFANTTQYGNNAHIAPQADITDGLVDVVAVSKIPVYLLPRIARKLFCKQKINSRFVSYYRTESLLVTCPEQYIHIDGEPMHHLHKEVSIYVKKKALKMLALP